MKNKKGFILLAVLVFLQWFLIFVISLFQEQFTSLKISRTLKESLNIKTYAFHLLKKIETKFVPSDCKCLISPTSTIFFKSQSLDWWLSDKTCYAKEGKFSCYFVVEDLKINECAFIYHPQNALTLKAHYYRITLFILPGKLLLQSTLVKPDNSSSVCYGIPHQVLLGRQMLIEL